MAERQTTAAKASAAKASKTDLPAPGVPGAEVKDADWQGPLTVTDTDALLRAAALNLMGYYVGHTDGNPRYLAQGNVTSWAPSLMEAVSLTHAGIQLYNGPVRPEEPGEPGKWVTRNVAGDADNATRASWYHPLERRDAAGRVAEGLALMGLGETNALAWFAPSREQLHKIATSGDPLATATNIATGATKVATADGLTSERRRKLDSAVKALLKRLKDGKPWSGTLADITAEGFTPDQVITAIERITQGTDDGHKWARTIRTALTPKADASS